MTLPELERVGFRGALGVRCRDAVSRAPVADGLVATVWSAADPTLRRAATRSPLSGLLGFGTFPRLRTYQHTAAAGGVPLTWPAPPPAVTHVVAVRDTQHRYLPVVFEVGVPAAAPVTVELQSAAGRGYPSGWAVLRGEVQHRTTHVGLGWAVVTVATDGASYDVVADERGRFLLVAPYPEALPPLSGSPPTGTGLSAMSWPATLTVRCQPSVLAYAPSAAAAADPGEVVPPLLASLEAQAAALQEVGGVLQADDEVTLAFGVPTVLTLLVEPAP